jgi:hypothetical protein
MAADGPERSAAAAANTASAVPAKSRGLRRDLDIAVSADVM